MLFLTAKATDAAMLGEAQVGWHHLELAPFKKEVNGHEVVDCILIILVQD
jgi:hypothetical protein